MQWEKGFNPNGRLQAAVCDIDPCTGHNFDDTAKYIDSAGLNEADLRSIREHNARTVSPPA